MQACLKICRMWSRNIIALTLIFSSGLFSATTAVAGDAVDVIVSGNSITASVTVADVKSVKLSIAGPDDFFVEEKSDAGYLYWSPRSGMADGEYNYEVFATTGSQTREDDDSRLYREHGRFKVQGGVFVNVQEPLSQGARTSSGQGTSLLAGLVLHALEWVIPDASAADLTASSTNPVVNFNDTDIPAIQWLLTGREELFGLMNNAGTPGWTFYIDSQSTSTAMWQQGNNDLGFADDSVFIDYSRDFGGVPGYAVGLGTTTPVEALHIVHPFPAIRIDDGGTGIWTLQEISDDFRIKSETDNSDRLTIQAVTGNVGINNQNPAESLDVSGKIKAAFDGANSLGDGMTKVFKMNANNTDLAKSSDVGFELSNTKAGFSWAFRTFEGPQGFAATKQGTGGSEFTIENTSSDYTKVVLRLGSGATNTNGQWINASSRAYKDNIQDLSAADAIKALDDLTPVTYTFKNDASKDLNVGFIAEDTPELISMPDRKGLNPLEIVAMLTRVVKEQQQALKAQAAINQELQQAIEQQKQLLDTLLEKRADPHQPASFTTSLLVQ